MKNINKILFYIILSLSTAISCGEEEIKPIETDPKKAILGKWEIIEIGNWPNMFTIENSLGYIEFCKDSILKEFEYETGNITLKRYWIDSLLYECIYREGSWVPIFSYKYKFYDNKLQLDATDFMLNNTSIYKRIN